MAFQNIAAYKFVTIPEAALPDVRLDLLDTTSPLDLKGTILLSTEGINLTLSGTANAIATYQARLASSAYFQDLTYRTSESEQQPFQHMLVKCKNEIIAFGQPNIQPEHHPAPYISPRTFKQWLDEHRDIVVLDTRNEYEIRIGSFDHALDCHIQNFRDFPEAIDNLSEELKNKPVVTFCTGGIRCEKAAPFLLEHGFKEVYQLEGGILQYFEDCGGEHYRGECFVFDDRIAVDPALRETGTRLCSQCHYPVTQAEQATPHCPHCKIPLSSLTE